MALHREQMLLGPRAQILLHAKRARERSTAYFSTQHAPCTTVCWCALCAPPCLGSSGSGVWGRTSRHDVSKRAQPEAAATQCRGTAVGTGQYCLRSLGAAPSSTCGCDLHKHRGKTPDMAPKPKAPVCDYTGPMEGEGSFYYQNGGTYCGAWRMIMPPEDATPPADGSSLKPTRVRHGKGVFTDGALPLRGSPLLLGFDAAQPLALIARTLAYCRSVQLRRRLCGRRNARAG